MERQAREVERQWRLRLERARYEAQLAERRYKAVDPDNRVVARTLEREWNEKLDIQLLWQTGTCSELSTARRPSSERATSPEVILGVKLGVVSERQQMLSAPVPDTTW